MREKRKPASTQHLDAEKRRCLSWNMYDAERDAVPSSSQDGGICLADDFLPDQSAMDSSQELAAPQPVAEEVVISQLMEMEEAQICLTDQFHITRSKYHLIKNSSTHKMKVHLDPPRVEETLGLLCSLELQLNPVVPAIENYPRPQSLLAKSASLFLQDARGFDFLVFDRDVPQPVDHPSRKDANVEPSSFLCFAVNVEKRPSPKCFECLEQLHVRNQGKLVQLSVRKYDGESGGAVLDVWLMRGIAARPAFGAQCPHRKRYAEYVRHLMNWFHGFSLPALGKCKMHKRYDYSALFDRVRQYHQNEEELEVIDVQQPALVPVLRPYQRDAVCWMVMKERVDYHDKDRLHVLWKEFRTVDNKTLYYNHYSGEITSHKQVMPRIFPGGILADEMGLGKTVEVLATILANPRTNKPLHGPDGNPPLSAPPEAVRTAGCERSVEHPGIPQTDGPSAAEAPDQGIGGASPCADAPSPRGDGGEAQLAIVQEIIDLTIQETSESISMDRTDADEAQVESEKPKIFQCLCGRMEPRICHPACVECLECGAWQHAACVGFRRHMPQEPCERVQYWCPHCFLKVPPIPSRGTLIISPAAICHQWVDEINRHINFTSLRVMVYHGVKRQMYIQPKTLAEYDIVITTYRTLRNELDYANLPHPGTEGRNLRHTKRYMTTPSPMPCVEWWRVCLDEAQMIEYTTAKSAEMAGRLSARNRWCVTGTPIQKSLDDLYGLFLFLGVEPFWVKSWWDLLLSAPYSRGDREPLQKALCKVFWRSAKRDVLDQIALPPQTEEVHWLDFSAIESHFYKRKHEECSRSFTFHSLKTRVLPETKLSTLDRKSLQTLLGPLLRVRQACCHPHVVRGEFTTLQKKRQLSMRDLLATMIGRAEVESDGAHRQLVCAINGLAAVHCIKNEIATAVKMYREVLKSAEEHKAHVKTDKLQLMHAIHNLREILRDRPEVVELRPEDDDLQQKVQSLREEYLLRTENLVTNSLLVLQPIRDKVTELESKVPSGPPWYLDGIQWVVYRGLGQDLVDRLKTELEAKTEAMGLVDKFRDVRGFQFIIFSELTKLEELYRAAWTGVSSLRSRLQESTLLAEATDCHLRPFGGRVKETCAFCRVAHKLQSYEMKLFSFDDRNVGLQDVAGPSSDDPADPDRERVNPLTGGPRGSWAASETERALRVLHGFLKLSHADDTILEDGSVFLEKMEQLRKEFKPLRAYWGAMRDRVAAMDELEMAMLRLRVKLPGEETDPASQPYIIEPLEVDQQRFKFMNDRLVAQNDLRRKLGQLVYLQNLRKAQYDLKQGRNPEPCPICVRPLGVQWTVLQCGHCFCSDCMDVLLGRAHVAGRQRAVRCAVCRATTEGTDISYVSAAPQQDPTDEANSIRIVGDHSTKIEAVVRTLKMIQLKEPGAKALVFSTWAEVLELIAKALQQNQVGYRNACINSGSKYFQASLLDFKQEPDITALLLPVHSGSKGLNIVEATHVLLVEPILNPASEMQAVGRVHRIGQNRPTVIHRFLVHNTIEEKLHSYLRTRSIRDGLNWVETDTGDMTLADLKKLFAAET